MMTILMITDYQMGFYSSMLSNFEGDSDDDDEDDDNLKMLINNFDDQSQSGRSRY